MVRRSRSFVKRRRLRRRTRKRRSYRRYKRRNSINRMRIVPNALPYTKTTLSFLGIQRSYGSLDNCSSYVFMPILGHNHFYWDVLVSKGQGGDDAKTDKTFVNSNIVPDGFTSEAGYLGYSEDVYSKTNHLNNIHYFKNIRQEVIMRNMDLNPAYVTVYKCCIRKNFAPGIENVTDKLLRMVFDTIYSTKSLTKDALDATTIAGGGLLQADWTYRSFMTADKEWSLYKASEFVRSVLIMKKKTYIVGPGQIVKVKQKCKSHFRRGIDCLDEDINPAEFDTYSTATSEFYDIYNQATLNSIKKGEKAKFLIFKVTGFLGSKAGAPDTIGRIAPNVVFEVRSHCDYLPTIMSKARYDTSVTNNAGAFSGPSEFADAS